LRSARRSDDSPELGSCGFDPFAESVLFGGIVNVEIVCASEHSGRAIDEFAEDVRVTCVTLGGGDDVDHDVMQRDTSIPPAPPVSNATQREFG
jgi:hypothetical protein